MSRGNYAGPRSPTTECRIDENRIHELEIGLKHAITFVLQSMNEGVDVEVSTPPEADAERESVEDEVKELQAQIASLRIELTQIAGALPDRSKPILQLPEIPPDREPVIPKSTTRIKGKERKFPTSS